MLKSLDKCVGILMKKLLEEERSFAVQIFPKTTSSFGGKYVQIQISTGTGGSNKLFFQHRIGSRPDIIDVDDAIDIIGRYVEKGSYHVNFLLT